MADKFIGLKVSVLLNTSIRLEGIVSQLEPASQQMILKDGKTLSCHNFSLEMINLSAS